MTVPGSRRPERAAARTLAARLPAGVPGAPGGPESGWLSCREPTPEPVLL